MLFLLCHCLGWVATGMSLSLSGFHLSVMKRPFYGPPTCWECPWDPGDMASSSLPLSHWQKKGWLCPVRGRWMVGCRPPGDLYLKTRTCHLAAAGAWRNCQVLGMQKKQENRAQGTNATAHLPTRALRWLYPGPTAIATLLVTFYLTCL